MNFYIDVEATQPANEIISIGVVAENGDTFSSLVQPTLSELDNYVSELTHITKTDLEEAPDIDLVLSRLSDWIINRAGYFLNAHFYSYGNDCTFFKATLPAVKSTKSFICIACIMANLQDISSHVFDFFHGTVSLINAFNYIKCLNNEQKHDPLEDAQMLRTIIDFTRCNEPLKINPCRKLEIETEEFIYPHGEFYCRRDKREDWTRLGDSHAAIEWFIERNVNPIDREAVSRKHVMAKMMKAVRSKTKYGDYYWKRIKD